MIHSTDSRVAQDFCATQSNALWRSKQIVYAAVINRCVPGLSPEIAKILQSVTVGLAIILDVVRIQARLIFGVQLKVKVASD
jgi:hypothetical protein